MDFFQKQMEQKTLRNRFIYCSLVFMPAKLKKTLIASFMNCFVNASISENNHLIHINNRAKFHACITNWTIMSLNSSTISRIEKFFHVYCLSRYFLSQGNCVNLVRYKHFLVSTVLCLVSQVLYQEKYWPVVEYMCLCYKYCRVHCVAVILYQG